MRVRLVLAGYKKFELKKVGVNKRMSTELRHYLTSNFFESPLCLSLDHQ